jgi:hypothetical protein
MFPLTSRLQRLMGSRIWTLDGVVALDAWSCRGPVSSDRYHAASAQDKLRPTAVAYVLAKAPV